MQAILKLLAGTETAVLRRFYDSFPNRTQKLDNASYFEAARSSRIRSILSVCEEFENEADAEIAALGNFYSGRITTLIIFLSSNIRAAKALTSSEVIAVIIGS